MIQVYNPNFGVGAIRGWCLKYVDDAGNAPARKGTAKAAFYAEQGAGRIRGGDSPVGVWVVGFADFTAGPFTKEGHVFFMKHNGNGRYEIRDSEVGAGARGPYGSIGELLAWFGAYKPKILGWSTDCDGRQYVKEVKMGLLDDGARKDLCNILGLPDDLFKEFVGMDYRDAFYKIKDTEAFRRNFYINKGDLPNYTGAIPSVEEAHEFGIQLGPDIARPGAGVTHKDAVYRLLKTGRMVTAVEANDLRDKLSRAQEKIKELESRPTDATDKPADEAKPDEPSEDTKTLEKVRTAWQSMNDALGVK